MMARCTVVVLIVLAPAMACAGSCDELTKLTLANTAVTAATQVPTGTFTRADNPARPVTVPAFCRVQLRATPVPDLEVGMEVWLRQDNAWNGKLLGIGNGGYSSVLDYPAMADGLRADGVFH